MFNNSGYSLADLAAATGRNNNGGFGDDGWWIILLFLFTGFGRGGGWGGAGGGTTREEISYGFDMNGIENGIRGIQQGLCDGFYAMNTGMLNGFSGVHNALCQGFSGINQTVSTNANSLENNVQAIGTQLAACCCDIRSDVTKGFADLGYALATQECATRQAVTDAARDIIASNEAGTRAILDFLTQDKIAALTAENQSLKFAASQQAQNNYLVSALKDPCPVPAYVVPNPNCCYGVATYNTCCGNYGF